MGDKHNTTFTAVAGLCLLMIATGQPPALAEESDTFQQVINYVFTGNPQRQTDAYMTAKIFDRENCVAGGEDKLGGTFKIYWNNIDPGSIDYGYKYFSGNDALGTAGGGMMALSFSGSPFVVDAQVRSALLYAGFVTAGITDGRHSSVTFPAPGLSSSRLKEALRILYTEHCTGNKSAF